MAYAKTPRLTKRRGVIKRKLKSLIIVGWKNDESSYKLKSKLRKAIN
jgi:hypothetical protein